MVREKIRKPFRFKRFSVNHNQSSMPVGVDGVLIGAWAGRRNAMVEALSPERILDVGCGCGLIALMCAQRFGNAYIDAIDIDEASVQEAAGNVAMSIYNDRISVKLADVCEYAKSHSGVYDLIVSNPPYFAAGVLEPSTRRERARHQGVLSPVSLMNLSAGMLTDGGRLAMIMPMDCLEVITGQCGKFNFIIDRLTMVRGNEAVVPKRIMIQLRKSEPSSGIVYLNVNNCDYKSMMDTLTIEYSRGNYTEQYRELTKDFYLKF